MKKVMILIAGLVGLTITANAQQLAASKVPSAVKTAFAKAHPDLKSVSWEKEKTNYEAGFKLNGKKTSELYTLNGMMTESEVAIMPTELPAEARNYIASHYKGVKIKEAAKITRTNGEITYEAEINGKDVIFDAKGNPVK
ncbi:PepSY-like domain-containing protein [Pedobacter gandavensis]|uniref:Putative beta-lactamase-inhibitor-like PepSY-like domain-containing protein n=1 Tax=Pedobacter gandavensis TaxID=2679963 RepID=A0ABR6ESL6_9SPHI|nr:PepSY-like domain-containing protein [Pedobacter gandavensis]MBB2148254.1 hypothetical protein [Pedobacter gandavensis]